MTTRELVEKVFIDKGFTHENPNDLDLIADILQKWLDKQDGPYSDEQYVLLSDSDVIDVLNACKLYYGPKDMLSNVEIKDILKQIATGQLTRRGYDYKNGQATIEEPSFGERLTALRMLKEDTPEDNKEMVQFINDIDVKLQEKGDINDTKQN